MSDSDDASSEPGDVPLGTTLWHYSNEEISGALTPRLGGRRHDGEDPRLAGKPAVWLATPRTGSADYAGDGIQIYEYEIVVPEGARVYKCRAHAAKVKQEAAAFNDYLRSQGKEPMKEEDFATHQYYGSLDPLPVKYRRKWDFNTATYLADEPAEEGHDAVSEQTPDEIPQGIIEAMEEESGLDGSPDDEHQVEPMKEAVLVGATKPGTGET